MQIVELANRFLYFESIMALKKHANVLVCGAEIKCIIQNNKTGTVSLESEPADSFEIDPSQYTVFWEA